MLKLTWLGRKPITPSCPQITSSPETDSHLSALEVMEMDIIMDHWDFGHIVDHKARLAENLSQDRQPLREVSIAP